MRPREMVCGRKPRICPAARSGRAASPRSWANTLPVPSGMTPIIAVLSARPCRTSKTVPSPPQANTASQPSRIAARACSPAEPRASVASTRTSTPPRRKVSAIRRIVAVRYSRLAPETGLNSSRALRKAGIVWVRQPLEDQSISHTFDGYDRALRIACQLRRQSARLRIAVPPPRPAPTPRRTSFRRLRNHAATRRTGATLPAVRTGCCG